MFYSNKLVKYGIAAFFVTVIPPNMVAHYLHTLKFHVTLFTFIYFIIMGYLKMAHQYF
jgi:hypothetical protein